MTAFLFRLHRWIGLGAALFLCLIGLTGSFLVFHDGIDRLLRPEAYRVVPRGEKLPLDVLVGKARQAWPGAEVFGVSTEDWGKPDATLLLRLHRGSEYPTASIDPYAGAPLGLNLDQTTRWILRLHDGFLLDKWGRTAFFFVGVALVVLGLTGLAACRGRWRALARWPRWEQGSRAGWGDLHLHVGFYTLLFNTMMGFTGAWMNFYFVAHLFQGHAPERKAVHYQTAALPLEQAVAVARQALPGLQPSAVFFPAVAGGPLRVMGDVSGEWFSNRFSNTVALDSGTGRVIQVKDFRKLHGLEKVQALVVPLHFGDFAGWPVKVLYTLGGLAPAVLSLSGCLIWFSRRRAAR